MQLKHILTAASLSRNNESVKTVHRPCCVQVYTVLHSMSSRLACSLLSHFIVSDATNCIFTEVVKIKQAEGQTKALHCIQKLLNIKGPDDSSEHNRGQTLRAVSWKGPEKQSSGLISFTPHCNGGSELGQARSMWRLWKSRGPSGLKKNNMPIWCFRKQRKELTKSHTALVSP